MIRIFASFLHLQSTYNGALFTTEVDTVTVPTDEGIDVKFDFADADLAVSYYTGVKQGYIPTIGFKMI